MKKFNFFRKKYPRFVYEGFETKLTKTGLKIVFDFRIQTAHTARCNCFAIKEPEILFQPEITIKRISASQLNRVGEKALRNLIFHLGLIEMLSYWKATCSPEIVIKAGDLDKEQIKWWKKVIERGMGQFFYENKINFKVPNMIEAKPLSQPLNEVSPLSINLSDNKILVPIGGGKDSIVTLELLKQARQDIQCFSLNPTPPAKKVMKLGGCKHPIIVERKIDKQLLKLNKKGYLNGHTPFSAYLAFLGLLVAVLFNRKYIVFSNERSSNEGNVKYLGKVINHQWSKSFEFEKMFRGYAKKYLVKDIEYFSFLRPLYEIQIAKIFSHFPKYFPIFLSCNQSYKRKPTTYKLQATSYNNKWCGKCPKCLFVFVVLYPFVKEKQLLKIFGKNLFKDKKLLPLMQQLTGERGVKPFECVGTKKETLAAFNLSLKKCRSRIPPKLPFLLEYFEKRILPKHPNLQRESRQILNSWNKNNFLPKKFKNLLK